MQTGNLFDGVASDTIDMDWTPEAPPCLDGIDEIELDFETSGLDWHGKARPIGAAVRLPDGSAKYYPWGHEGGGNLDEATMKRWFKEQVKHKRITNLHIGFEIHQAYAWGVDLEAQGNTVADVGHYAALLDDHRYKFSLEALSQDYLHDESVWAAARIDKTRMKHYHAGQVAAGACQDVLRVGAMKPMMRKMMTAEGLDEVRKLEEEVIYAVCEMERNAVLLDVELLNRWKTDTEQELLKCAWQLYRETGMQINPDSRVDLEKLFKHLKLPIYERTDAGNASFTDAILKKIDHPTIKLVRRAAHLTDLRNKYILPYLAAVDANGLLRFHLHQLRTSKDALDKHGAGTVSGRFSMTDENLQQVLAVEKQVDKYGQEYIIRELFIAAQMGMAIEEYNARKKEGTLTTKWLSADAAQIEYRLFAHYAASPKILQAYRDNPRMSFHKETWEMIKPYKPDLLYKPLKNLNFAQIYGAGLIKKAVMMEFITEAEGDQIRAECSARKQRHATHPKLLQAAQVEAVYNQQIPEVKALSEKAMKLAESRGYVRTIKGRRCRFIDKQRTHKALNGVIQGGAADLMKMKLVELHKERKRTGFVMRLTVHDEVCGDSPSPETTRMVDEILNRQPEELQLKVPILWDVNTGDSWAEHDIKKLKAEGVIKT